MAQLKLRIKKSGAKNPVTKVSGFSARVLTNGTAAFDDIVREAGKNTTMHKAELRMAFELCMDSVTEMLKQGFIVELGPLGKHLAGDFFLSGHQAALPFLSDEP